MAAAATVSPGCGTVFKITPSGRAYDAIQLLHGKVAARTARYPQAALVQADQWKILRDNHVRRVPRLVYGTVFQITPTGMLTTLYSFCARGECTDGYGPVRGADPGDQWGPVRDNGGWRGPRRWDNLQNHCERHADDAIQLRRQGRRNPHGRAGPGHRWAPLRDNPVGRGHCCRRRIQPVRRSGPVSRYTADKVP